jgi:hypothetical protein
MGARTTSRSAFESARKRFVADEGPATARAEQHARKTGKLNPLVDPSGYGVIRRSLPRLEKQENGLWILTVGTPMPIETRADTTASMGDNIDIVLRVLPNSCDCYGDVLPGYDQQIATGIFGDISDSFVLCRPQFEMEAEKIVEQLTLMVPDRDGGDYPEDPHYGLFGAAYLTSAYINRIGLKGYDFTISDAPARDQLDERELIRIFGKEVFEKVAENGQQIKKSDLPSTKEVVQDLLQRSHAFFLQVGDESSTQRFWTNVFGQNRVVGLPSTEVLPQVQAAIIGLTEGTLTLSTVEKFLLKNNVPAPSARKIIASVANIPIGAQAKLPNFKKRPQKGDLFKSKTDLWPVNPDEIEKEAEPKKGGKNTGKTKWL